jgi:nicotinamidase-related amidase
MSLTFDSSDISNPGHYGPSQTALLLLDFHSLFVQQASGPTGSAALGVAAKLRTWAKAQGIHVIHCLVDLDDAPVATSKDINRLLGIQLTMRASGGEESVELSEGGAEGEITFTRKPGFVSALKSPGLEDYLQKKGITSLVLTGLSTSGCVNRTALSAPDAEYVVTVISDGCADRDQEVHDTLVKKVFIGRGYVASGAEFQKAFEEAGKK